MAGEQGSKHYRSLGLQPWAAMEAWGHPLEFFGFLRYCALKRIARLETKGDILQDIDKSIHELEKLRGIYLKYQDDIEAALAKEGTWDFAIKAMMRGEWVRREGWPHARKISVVVGETSAIVDVQNRVFTPTIDDFVALDWAVVD